jgi:hypothetical protein
MYADGKPARDRTRILTDSTKKTKQERSLGEL